MLVGKTFGEVDLSLVHGALGLDRGNQLGPKQAGSRTTRHSRGKRSSPGVSVGNMFTYT